MIYLDEVCEKLQEILNSNDNPIDFLYAVEAVGFHQDSIYDNATNRNMIRVYVSTFGGEFNPVPDLGQANYSIPITFYFPVRFKESFFALDAYLHDYFVGRMRDFGEKTGRCACNLSISNYGEIQDQDLMKFKVWADSVYKKPVEVMEAYMSMTLTLYLGTIADGFVFGNDLTATLGFTATKITISYSQTESGYGYKLEGGKQKPVAGHISDPYITDKGLGYVQSGSIVIRYANGFQMGTITATSSTSGSIPLVFAQGSMQTMSQSNDNQFIGEYESDGFPFATAIGTSFSVYLNDSVESKLIFNEWALARINDLDLTLNLEVTKLDFYLEKPIFLSSGNLVINKGQPLAITFSFAKRTEVNDA